MVPALPGRRCLVDWGLMALIWRQIKPTPYLGEIFAENRPLDVRQLIGWPHLTYSEAMCLTCVYLNLFFFFFFCASFTSPLQIPRSLRPRETVAARAHATPTNMDAEEPFASTEIIDEIYSRVIETELFVS